MEWDLKKANENETEQALETRLLAEEEKRQKNNISTLYTLSSVILTLGIIACVVLIIASFEVGEVGYFIAGISTVLSSLCVYAVLRGIADISNNIRRMTFKK